MISLNLFSYIGFTGAAFDDVGEGKICTAALHTLAALANFASLPKQVREFRLLPDPIGFMNAGAGGILANITKSILNKKPKKEIIIKLCLCFLYISYLCYASFQNKLENYAENIGLAKNAENLIEEIKKLNVNVHQFETNFFDAILFHIKYSLVNTFTVEFFEKGVLSCLKKIGEKFPESLKTSLKYFTDSEFANKISKLINFNAFEYISNRKSKKTKKLLQETGKKEKAKKEPVNNSALLPSRNKSRTQAEIPPHTQELVSKGTNKDLKPTEILPPEEFMQAVVKNYPMASKFTQYYQNYFSEHTIDNTPDLAFRRKIVEKFQNLIIHHSRTLKLTDPKGMKNYQELSKQLNNALNGIKEEVAEETANASNRFVLSTVWSPEELMTGSMIATPDSSQTNLPIYPVEGSDHNRTVREVTSLLKQRGFVERDTTVHTNYVHPGNGPIGPAYIQVSNHGGSKVLKPKTFQSIRNIIQHYPPQQELNRSMNQGDEKSD